MRGYLSATDVGAHVSTVFGIRRSSRHFTTVSTVQFSYCIYCIYAIIRACVYISIFNI